LTTPRRLAVLTTGRQDFGILRSTCKALHDDAAFDLQLVVGGMHLSAQHGDTAAMIEADGLPIAARVAGGESLAPSSIAGAFVEEVAHCLRSLRPIALMLVGDRSETAAAALAAQLERVPIVHLHGGEETEGAIDNALRHAITKLSHLHLVSHAHHARRVLQMGELDAAVHVVGAPGLDNMHRHDLPDRAALEAALGIDLRPPVILVTQQPTTLGAGDVDEAAALVEALREVDGTYIVTAPNNDAGAAATRDALERFVAARPQRAVLTPALGEARYFGLMKLAAAVLGNSSSGLIEAPIVRLPAINIGDRQKGRLRGDNVIDVEPTAAAIRTGIERALSPAFRSTLSGVSPYGDGRSAARIIRILADWQPPNPPRKRFCDRTFQ
jgi:UDP-hydrolysing UDP-N-acetyl-D-glucosamine 2-epimerase